MRFFAAAAGVIAVASAYTFPTPFGNPAATGAAPSGNAIVLPDTTHPVTLGQSFDITWEPSSAGPVALILCKGPSTDCEPTLTIAEKIPNSGKFSWVPFGLAPSADSSSGYGIMLVDYSDKSYQYTTQFGVLAGSKPKPSGPTSSGPSPSSSVVPSSSVAVPSTVVVPVTATSTFCPEGTATATATWTTSVGTTGLPSPTTTTTPKGPSPPMFTNGADHNMASFGAVGAIAGLAALLAF